uniref:C3H1-type domain-containing protein n=1 Tax=Chromera velia CCMP2878 TaxID=1169474 RepID=A0A0G4F543_9ALVE|eukprot:Cvel_15188.t1-p1 / transcript=Cvel_15188.t1 / gene=Cvel_15188 / organism=Chromera_velia_CCMP2878 / gene_product=Zinc finger protein 283, putative / transcript_product=Zinc finger protein 283, putative / location=Cvel_scaffold1110:42951-47088(+) / protein_length=395 / sequence_SO=supercontig / SO=protein_coding / is_pseudo=false
MSSSQEVCKHFAQGNCRYGDKCRQAHHTVATKVVRSSPDGNKSQAAAHPGSGSAPKGAPQSKGQRPVCKVWMVHGECDRDTEGKCKFTHSLPPERQAAYIFLTAKDGGITQVTREELEWKKANRGKDWWKTEEKETWAPSVVSPNGRFVILDGGKQEVSDSERMMRHYSGYRLYRVLRGSNGTPVRLEKVKEYPSIYVQEIMKPSSGRTTGYTQAEWVEDAASGSRLSLTRVGKRWKDGEEAGQKVVEAESVPLETAVLTDAFPSALLALIALTAVLTDALPSAFLALISPPAVLTDSLPAALLAPVTGTAVLTDPLSSALLAAVTLTAVLTNATSRALLALRALTAVLTNATSPALLASMTLTAVLTNPTSPALLASVTLTVVLTNALASALLT